MSTGSPLVSVLIPAYNSAPYVEELCRSLQSQTYQNFEVLILDDGSTDGTLEVLAPFRKDPRFQIFGWKENRGVSHATFELFGRANGEFWCHPGADDLLMPSFIQERLNAFCANPNAVMVHGPAKMIDERGQSVEDSNLKVEFPRTLQGTRLLGVLLQHNIIQTPSIMVRTSVTKALLPQLQCHWKYSQDWYFWILHLAAGSELVWDSRPLHKYRIHRRSLSTDPSKAAVRLAETRLTPLCALSRAARATALASRSWTDWGSQLYQLWLRRACHLRHKGLLQQAWIDIAAEAYYGKPHEQTSLLREVRTHLAGIIVNSWREMTAHRRQRLYVSGLAQVDDPIFR